MKITTKLCAVAAITLSFGLSTGCGNNEDNNDNNDNNTKVDMTKMDMAQDMPKEDMTKQDMPKEDMTEDMPKVDMDKDMEGPTPTCADYCATVTANCTGDNAQYSSEAECLSYCNDASGWDAGKAGDTAGNTVGCRSYHGGEPAKSDPATHCPHAGPSGANVCGTWCDNYCDLVFNNCTGGDKIYDTEAECATACGNFATDGDIGAVEYDTVQCRIYHLGTPAATDPGTHCPHGAADGGGVCVGDQNAYNFATDLPSAYTQVDRMGIPAVNTALISSKDNYNKAEPKDDANFVPEIAANLLGLHDALRDDVLGAQLTPCSTNDVVLGNDVTPCLQQRIFQGGPTVAEAAVPDVINIDPAGTAGFPNGRKLADPVMDVILAILLLDMQAHTPDALVGVLNPKTNDLGTEGAFLTTFPYLHPPHQ